MLTEGTLHVEEDVQFPNQLPSFAVSHLGRRYVRTTQRLQLLLGMFVSAGISSHELSV